MLTHSDRRFSFRPRPRKVSLTTFFFFSPRKIKLFSSILISHSPIMDKGLFTYLSNGSSPRWVLLLTTINYHCWIYVGEQTPYNYNFDLLIKQRYIYLSDGMDAVLMWGLSPWPKSRMRSQCHIRENENEPICVTSAQQRLNQVFKEYAVVEIVNSVLAWTGSIWACT